MLFMKRNLKIPFKQAAEKTASRNKYHSLTNLPQVVILLNQLELNSVIVFYHLSIPNKSSQPNYNNCDLHILCYRQQYNNNSRPWDRYGKLCQRKVCGCRWLFLCYRFYYQRYPYLQLPFHIYKRSRSSFPETV